MEYRVITTDQKDLILQTQRSSLKHMSDIEKQMLEWKASWREESLEHYLKTRWCMGIFSEDLKALKAYFLAQPILFLEGLTQNLWIEHMYYESPELGEKLIDLAIRYGKDKHLQRVIFKQDPLFEVAKLNFPIQKKEGRIEVLTTKLVL